MGVDDVQPRLAAGRLQHGIALVGQRPGGEHAHRVLVLDQQDGALAGQVARGCLGRLRRGLALVAGVLVDRQVDAEDRPFARLAFHEHETAGLLDDAVHGGQAQAGALAHLLGGEERLEHLVQVLRRDADAGVGHLDQHIVARRHHRVGLHHRIVRPHLAGADGQHAAVARRRVHGIARVDRHVDDHLLQLTLVHLDHAQVAAVGHLQLDVLADQPADQVGQFGQHVGYQQHLGPHGLLAREGQQLAHQIGRPVGVLLDLHDVGKRLVAGAVAHQQQVAEADDGGQQIVEIVGHAASQLAHRLHLLGLDELALQALLLGGVDQIQHHRRRAGMVDPAEIDLAHPFRLGVEAHVHRPLRRLARHRRGDVLHQRLAVVGHHQIGHRLAGAGVAVGREGDEGFVEVDQPAIGVHGGDAHGRVVEQGVDQRCLGALGMALAVQRHVAHQHQHAQIADVVGAGDRQLDGFHLQRFLAGGGDGHQALLQTVQPVGRLALGLAQPAGQDPVQEQHLAGHVGDGKAHVQPVQDRRQAYLGLAHHVGGQTVQVGRLGGPHQIRPGPACGQGQPADLAGDAAGQPGAGAAVAHRRVHQLAQRRRVALVDQHLRGHHLAVADPAVGVVGTHQAAGGVGHGQRLGAGLQQGGGDRPIDAVGGAAGAGHHHEHRAGGQQQHAARHRQPERPVAVGAGQGQGRGRGQQPRAAGGDQLAAVHVVGRGTRLQGRIDRLGAAARRLGLLRPLSQRPVRRRGFQFRYRIRHGPCRFLL